MYINGAIIDPSAKYSRAPNINKKNMIGINHHFFLWIIYPHNSIIIFIFSQKIIILLFGSNYASSIILLKYFALLLPFRYLVITYGTALSTAEHYIKKTSIYLKSCLFFVPSCSILSYYFNFQGVFISLVVTEIYLLVSYYIV